MVDRSFILDARTRLSVSRLGSPVKEQHNLYSRTQLGQKAFNSHNRLVIGHWSPQVTPEKTRFAVINGPSKVIQRRAQPVDQPPHGPFSVISTQVQSARSLADFCCWDVAIDSLIRANYFNIWASNFNFCHQQGPFPAWRGVSLTTTQILW